MRPGRAMFGSPLFCQAQDQLRILEQLDKRVSLLGAQSQRLKDSLPTRDQGRPFRAEAEATAAAATERRYVTAIKEAEREVLQLRWVPRQ